MGNATPGRVLIIQPMISHYRREFYHRFHRAQGDVTVFYHRPEDPQTTQRDYAFPTVKGRAISFLGLIFQFGFWRSIWHKRYDIVICNFDIHIVSSILLLLVCRCRGIKFMWYGIGFGTRDAFRPVRVGLVHWASALMVYEEEAANAFRAAGVPEDKIFVAHNTVHVEHPRINCDPTTRTAFLFLGTLYPEKRAGDLLRAFALVKPFIPENIGLDIVGRGVEEQSLIQLAEDLDISDRVTFHGEIREEDKLRPLFERAIVQISPGQAGLSVLMSFAHGVGFITRTGAISGGEIENIKHGVNGFLYGGSVEELADLMKSIAQNPIRGVQIGQAAYTHYITGRTMDHMVSAFTQAAQYLTTGTLRGG